MCMLKTYTNKNCVRIHSTISYLFEKIIKKIIYILTQKTKILFCCFSILFFFFFWAAYMHMYVSIHTYIRSLHTHKNLRKQKMNMKFKNA